MVGTVHNGTASATETHRITQKKGTQLLGPVSVCFRVVLWPILAVCRNAYNGTASATETHRITQNKGNHIQLQVRFCVFLRGSVAYPRRLP